MTPREAVRFAAALDESQDVDLAGERHEDAQRRVFAAIVAEAPRHLLAKLLNQRLRFAEAFRSANAPGHDTWYAYHLREAAVLALLLDPTLAAPATEAEEARADT